MIILFGGGDAGGIRITPKGIEPIPPWDPTLRLQLKGLNQLARARMLLDEEARVRHLDEPLTQLTHSVLTQVEALVGEIDAENGLVFQDADGGFTCGSTGKPPIPFPVPVDPRRTVEGLLSRSVLDEETLTFLQRAAAAKMDVFAVAGDPRTASEHLGLELSPGVENALHRLAKSSDALDDGVAREVVDFYKAVVADGRFIADWVIAPTEVAGKLGIDVSRDALDRIVATRDAGITGRLGGEVMSPAAVAVAVAIVIVLWSDEVDLPVLDRSGLQKL
ncbi:MAG: hypothetical protein U0Q21_01455 [Dermatophilaceae bacterium]